MRVTSEGVTAFFERYTQKPTFQLIWVYAQLFPKTQRKNNVL